MELNALNPFVAYEFDAAVATFGIIIKNALQETREVGMGTSKRLVPKYKIDDLLRDDFQFARQDPLDGIMGMDGYEEVA